MVVEQELRHQIMLRETVVKTSGNQDKLGVPLQSAGEIFNDRLVATIIIYLAPNQSRKNKFNYQKKEKFQGAHPDLSGYVFETAPSRTNQVANFSRVDERIRSLVGQNYDPYVLESIESRGVVLPPEPTLDTVGDARVNEIKYSKQYDRWLTRTEVIEKQLKQVYSIYYGQCDDEMKATLAEDPRFETIHQRKDTLGLFRILQSVNCSYKSGEEPILTLFYRY